MPISAALGEEARTTVILNTLRQCPLFEDMAPRDLRAIGEACEFRVCEKDDFLFIEGQKAEGFFIVQQGAINLSRLTPDGHEQIIAIFRPYNCFAEVCLTAFDSYPANAVALENSTVILVRKNAFKELIMAHPELALRMLTSMSFHLKHLIQVMEDQKFKSIESRLANHLLKHCFLMERAPASVIKLDTTKKVLAGRLGVSSETLSRTFARFRREGLIEVNQSQITLLDPVRLRNYLQDSE